jgi:AcrR family transcriptional regulator
VAVRHFPQMPLTIPSRGFSRHYTRDMPSVPNASLLPSTEVVATSPEPAWRQRAIERSTQSARLRAAKRVQRFLNAAREIIAEKASVEFTVQEVVDRSKQSLRSFYQYFDGKHELLLGLFEEEMEVAARRLRDLSAEGDPLDRLHAAVVMLYETGTPGRDSVQPLFFEFAQRLMLDHPEEVALAYAPVFEYLASIVEDAADAGLLRPGRPRRHATLLIQTVTTTAGRTEVTSPGHAHPFTGEEVWEFCLHAIVPDDVIAARERKEKGAASRAKRSS